MPDATATLLAAGAAGLAAVSCVLASRTTAQAGAADPPLGIGGAEFIGLKIVGAEQFTKQQVQTIFKVTDKMVEIVREKGGCDLLKGRLLANIFYEASTRTSCSFNAAMQRLGGRVVEVQVAAGGSSVKKGETLSDTVKCLESYCDTIVLRHPQTSSAGEAAAALEPTTGLLNAGNGGAEHPTQALLDLYTIQKDLGKDLDSGLKIALVGDLKHGRTVHSLAKMLSLFSGVELLYCAPPDLQMPAEVEAFCTAKGVAKQSKFGEKGLEEVIKVADVVYMTRVQRERFATPPSDEEYAAIVASYTVTKEMMALAKAEMRLLHPLPRVGEIKEEVDTDPRAAYFRQMRYGMYVRMALLALVNGKG